MIAFPPLLQAIGDYIVCICWVIAYTMCLIGTIKEKRPGFPPLATCVIFPWEIVASLIDSGIDNYYVSTARFIWFCLHLSFFIIGLYKLYRKKPLIILLHLLLLSSVTIALYYIFQIPGGQVQTSFFNTIISWIILLVYILKTDYPPSRMYLGFAVFGFLADAGGHLVYLNIDYVTSILCVTLQIIQLTHVILVYRVLKKANVPVFVFYSPSQILDTAENKLKTISNKISFILNKKVLKKPEITHSTKYKKKQKIKKTHRK